MLTLAKHRNGGGCAAAAPHFAPRSVRGPHLQPQGSLTRSLPRRPPAALDPGASATPTGAQRGQASACRLKRGTNKRPTYKITLTKVSTVSGDCRPRNVEIRLKGGGGDAGVTTEV